MSDDGATLLKVMITAVLSSPLCYAHRSAMLTTMLLQASAALPCLQLCYDHRYAVRRSLAHRYALITTMLLASERGALLL